MFGALARLFDEEEDEEEVPATEVKVMVRLGHGPEIRRRWARAAPEARSSVQLPSRRTEAPSEPRQASNLVGLWNQGATCYMNSLLQACFMLPEFREGLFAIDSHHLGVEHVRPPLPARRPSPPVF